jgi:protein-S-isoprenylcysteine O-methyltransferase Ste14
VLYLLRHLLSFLALPFTVTVVVPLLLRRPAGAPGPLSIAAGAVLGALGLALLASSIHHFFTRGRGTLAPWDPPRALVVSGPYRHVRNPMISGVISILFAEAALLGSRPHLGWALIFLVVNLIYIPLFEEPMLASRFGEPYEEYCRHVRRFVPRLRPWVREAVA